MRWLVALALCAGCRNKPAPPPPPKFEDAPVMPADAAPPDAAIDAPPPDAPPMTTTITSDGVGPINAKLIDEEDYKAVLTGLTVKSEHKEGEDFNFDEYVASKDSTPVLRAVITDRALFKVEVFDPMFATAAGVTVGMTVAQAAEKMKDLQCVFEKYDPEADAERIDRALRCDSPSLPHVMFDVDYEKFKAAFGKVGTKAIAKRKIVQIVWLAAE